MDNQSQLHVQRAALGSKDLEKELKVGSGISGGQESLLPQGYDKRTLVEDITQYPYRSICRVSIKHPDSKQPGVGTGCLIGRRTVLTCAHNCYDNQIKNKQCIVSVSFLKDKNDGTLGSQIPCKSYYPVEYKAGGKKDSYYDYAILHLQEDIKDFDVSPVPVDFSGKSIENLEEKNRVCMIAGFPTQVVPQGQKVEYKQKEDSYPKTYSLSNGRKNDPPKMYEHQAPFHLDKHMISHQVDTTPGNSGSPILIYTQEGVVCIGVHIQGYVDTSKLVKKILANKLKQKKYEIQKDEISNFGTFLFDHNYPNISKWYLLSEGKTLQKEPKYD